MLTSGGLMPLPLYLAVSLDVEEECLFSGSYASRAPAMKNIACLARLEPLLARGIRPTLFCAYSALADEASRDSLNRLRERVEFGGHLHHWNTPPLSLNGTGADLPDFARSVPSAAVPSRLMAAKLTSLFSAGSDFCGAPVTSFRMGRWDLRREHWPMLARAGVLCDASVRPLHCAAKNADGPDHFYAPSDPYWVHAEGRRIFEIPLTVTPLVRCVPHLFSTLSDRAGRLARAGLKNWGALALLPVQHPFRLMQLVTRLFASRGGRVLSLTWHSSEMMPGGAPHMPDLGAVTRLMDKISRYIDWLYNNWSVRSCTMSELRDALGASAPVPYAARAGDWTTRHAGQAV